ncbi:hypothetical protein BDF21DRAFT_345839 [Thamnidium elegans]|nr:hypothetical protein BDF21DRAFT_345839 [Thamnidium elegans]
MFKKPTIKESSYLSWLATAAELIPAYDYFDFANTVCENKKRSNFWYCNIMKKALNAAKREQKYIIAQKINEFNVLNYLQR